ncbi:tryptophanyl-tRNA synthetase [Dokdonella fugitiva]|uniref:Tryptophan--tRNA ligase n=1 Tax=Dokdonella fugitiva TaxID=328517 RepID=A0A839EZ18_9GAMM|nr:tryptophan--tRNA ligase [Dokdonella fugitiva]MBA8887596.1 tryptophanyl-tRNA synthetase [Dokdonella fugitiva]
MSHDQRRILTGITTSGTPHLGNYVGAIRPAIAASRRADAESFYFLADYHALIKTGDPARVQQSTLEIAASWLACGLDPDTVHFYRQSDIPEIPELTWFLTCVTAKGLLNRAHAYKAAVDQNSAAGEDADAGITAGLYMYPVLMAADILIFNAHEVPVGRDQIQHIEMARDIGQRFNHLYGGDYFTLPEARIEENVATLPGTDGRKMSKSYDNTIPLWLPAKDLRKAILGIVTDSRAPGEAKDPDTSNIFAIYQAFADADETAAMRRAFADGIAWGEAKQALFERVDAELAPMRERYDALVAEPERIEKLLLDGARRVREIGVPLLRRLRNAVGIRPLDEIHGSARGEASRDRVTSSGSALPQLKSYREADGKFYFKLEAADGALLLQSRAFDAPKDAGRLSAALVEAGDDATAIAALLSQCVPDAASVLPTEAIIAALARLKADKLAKKTQKN